MNDVEKEFWDDKEVQPQWARDNQAPLIERSKLPGPWEVQKPEDGFCGTAEMDDIFAPKNPIFIPLSKRGVEKAEEDFLRPLIDAGLKMVREQDYEKGVHVGEARFQYCADEQELKDTNPKLAFGTHKLQLNVVPNTLVEYTSLALLEGALKYGRYNWRISGALLSIYLDALKRHVAKFEEGQWADPKTKVPHLASAIASLTIILDAHLMGKLVDDRPPSLPNHDQWIDEQAEIVQHLRSLFSDKRPKQYTIADTPGVASNCEESCPQN